jgi:hypothetical protein
VAFGGDAFGRGVVARAAGVHGGADEGGDGGRIAV